MWVCLSMKKVTSFLLKNYILLQSQWISTTPVCRVSKLQEVLILKYISHILTDLFVLSKKICPFVWDQEKSLFFFMKIILKLCATPQGGVQFSTVLDGSTNKFAAFLHVWKPSHPFYGKTQYYLLYFRTVHVVIIILFKPTHALFLKHIHI